MRKSLHLSLMAAVIAFAAAGMAQQTTEVVVVPVTRTPASSGRQMFAAYCAVCHGADGRGNGEAASALKAPPADLTRLSATNGGSFPTLHVVSVLRFGEETSAHGSEDMPAWGPALRALQGQSPTAEAEEQLRISNLVDYLKSMQQ